MKCKFIAHHRCKTSPGLWSIYAHHLIWYISSLSDPSTNHIATTRIKIPQTLLSLLSTLRPKSPSKQLSQQLCYVTNMSQNICPVDNFWKRDNHHVPLFESRVKTMSAGPVKSYTLPPTHTHAPVFSVNTQWTTNMCTTPSTTPPTMQKMLLAWFWIKTLASTCSYQNSCCHTIALIHLTIDAGNSDSYGGFVSVGNSTRDANWVGIGIGGGAAVVGVNITAGSGRNYGGLWNKVMQAKKSPCDYCLFLLSYWVLLLWRTGGSWCWRGTVSWNI